MRSPPRAFRLSRAAEEVAESLKDSDPFFEDSLRALEWLLVRSPGSGEQLSHPILYVYRLDSVARGLPILRVVYRYDGDEITVHKIGIVHEEKGANYLQPTS